jgi:hypothetical protein
MLIAAFHRRLRKTNIMALQQWAPWNLPKRFRATRRTLKVTARAERNYAD